MKYSFKSVYNKRTIVFELVILLFEGKLGISHEVYTIANEATY
jgi:hypothetical protein